MSENYFKELYDINFKDKLEEKNGLTYIKWAASWAEVKKLHPDAQYTVYEDDTVIEEEVVDEERKTVTSTRKIFGGKPWFDDGKTGWVKTSVTINGIEHIDRLPIMDFRNKAIPADNITSTDVNKTIQRSLVRAAARHGCGLYVYESLSDTELNIDLSNIKNEIMEILGKKSKLSENTKIKVGEVCKEILVEENGDPRLCEDLDKLKELKKKLMAVRKIAD